MIPLFVSESCETGFADAGDGDTSVGVRLTTP